MKKQLFPSIAAVALVAGSFLLGGCQDYDEEPPQNQEFDREFVLPTPTELSDQEYANYLSLLEEYNQAVPQQ